MFPFGVDRHASCSFLQLRLWWASLWSELPSFRPSPWQQLRVLLTHNHPTGCLPQYADGSRNEFRLLCYRMSGRNPDVEWKFDGSMCYRRITGGLRLLCPSWSTKQMGLLMWMAAGARSLLCASVPLSAADTRYPLAKRLQGKARASSQPALLLHSKAVISKAVYAIKRGQTVQNKRRNISS